MKNTPRKRAPLAFSRGPQKNDREQLLGFVEIWKSACADFVALARTIPDDQAHLPTDLAGWDVADNIAHTAHLEAVLAGAPEETVEVDAGEHVKAAHIKNVTGHYTEQGVLARRGRSIAELCDEIEDAVARRYAELQADPPEDGSAPPPRTPGGVPWNTRTLLSNRPLDVWMHEQDIRRAIDRPGGFDSPAAAHTMRVFRGALPMVLGKRVGAAPGTSVVIEIPLADMTFGAIVGDDGRAAPGVPDEPTTRITLPPEAFVILAGGRRTPDSVEAVIAGDAELAGAVLASLAVTP